MRKQIIDSGSQAAAIAHHNWLDLERLARVELTSEESAFPIEAALVPDVALNWRAQEPGPQIIRLLFDEPQRLRRIHLMFQEDEYERTQEFVVRWSSDGGRTYREVVRQQYNFSPPASNREVEDYAVELDGVTALELDIVPDISRGSAKATLSKLLLA